MCSWGVADCGRGLSPWQTLIIFNPGRISLKWKAAFQIYNPVDLISPRAAVHAVQLRGRRRPGELVAQQTPLKCPRGVKTRWPSPIYAETPPTHVLLPDVALQMEHWLDFRLCVLCVCVCVYCSIWPSWHHNPHTWHIPRVQRQKVLTTVKEEVARVKNADSVDSRGSAWRTGATKVAAAGQMSLWF